MLWLSASQARRMERTGQPNSFATMEYNLINAIAPLRRWYYGRPLNILLESTLVSAPSSFPQETGLGEPVATNSSGVRVWIVRPDDAPKFHTKFEPECETNSHYELISRPRVQTRDGLYCSIMSTFSTFPYYGGTMPVTMHPTTPQGDFEIKIVPETDSDSYDLTMAVTLVAPPQPPFNTIVRSEAIVPFGFRVRVPKNGALVMDCGPFKDRSGSPYWFVVVPSDARRNRPAANPIHPPAAN